MKIISHFRDYYDNASGWHSNEPLYVRKQQRHHFDSLKPEIKSALKPALTIFRKIPRTNHGSRHLFAFCGKLYPGYQSMDRTVFFCLDKLEAYCREIIKNRSSHANQRINAKETMRELERRIRPFGNFTTRLSFQSWKTFLQENDMTLSADPFLAVQAPIFLLRDPTFFEKASLVINPKLYKYNFVTQIDPATAYQELDMYLGNDMAVQMNPDIPRTDNLIRDAKGFDGWSFKRHKEESKKPRKKKKAK